MRLAQRFRPTVINKTTRANSKKNAERIAENLKVLKALSSKK